MPKNTKLIIFLVVVGLIGFGLIYMLRNVTSKKPSKKNK